MTVRLERAILVSVALPHRPFLGDDPLDELRGLATTAGAQVVGGLTQKRHDLIPGTYIGKGKLAELTDLVKAEDADVVIFDNDLSPAQVRNLEKATGAKVIDRSELILDIFATRARSVEAKLQVELAQLEYALPRLRKMWTHLSRYKGGIGLRGPGETQLEEDRRLVALKIRDLKERLSGVQARKERAVSSRFEEHTVSLVGYTNAGKSTLLNALAGSARAVVSPVPGTTRDAISADVRLQRGIVRIHDVAGLDHARDDAAAPMHVQDDIEQQMRQQALRTIEQADVVVLVRDPNDGHGESHWPRQPDLVVLSKADLVAAEGLHSGIAVSAITGQGMSALRGALDERAFGAASPQAALALNSRHLSAVAQARRALHHIAQAPQDVGPELLALDLREALDELGAILGRVTPDELLGRIFSRFCIGK
jgi:GTP-binding protein HflX